VRGLHVLVFGAVLTAGLCAWAYIPSTANILRKTVKTHGDGAYQIDQEVQFQLGSNPVLVHETWTVENGDSIRLTARPVGAKSWSITILYTAGRRFVWEDGKVKSYPLSPDFVENLFHFRGLTDMTQRLVDMKVLPSRALRNTNTAQYSPESWVRLGRVGGSISLVLGETQNPATLWVEQDSFLIQRIRLASQAEVVIDENREQTPQLTFPQVRRYLWNQHSVLARTTKVTPITMGPKTKPLMSPQSLAQDKDNTLPEEPVVREFYSRFR
jgi:hypothetical protein